MGEYKSRLQITREEKAKGKHHTQKKETFAGAPTLAGAAEVGTAFAKSSVDDSGAETKWTFRIPILADFGGQRVGDIFGDEVRGLHSTYNNKIKKQIEKSSKEKRKKDKTGKVTVCQCVCRTFVLSVVSDCIEYSLSPFPCPQQSMGTRHWVGIPTVCAADFVHRLTSVAGVLHHQRRVRPRRKLRRLGNGTSLRECGMTRT